MVKKIKNKPKSKSAKEKPPKRQNYEPAQNKYNNFVPSIKTILLTLEKLTGLKAIINFDIHTTKSALEALAFKLTAVWILVFFLGA